MIVVVWALGPAWEVAAKEFMTGAGQGEEANEDEDE